MSDITFVHSVHRMIQGRLNSGGTGKNYLFRFAVDSPTQNQFLLKGNRPDIRGVFHADELSYLFKHNYGSIPERKSMEFKTIERFVSERIDQGKVSYHLIVHLGFNYDVICHKWQSK